MSHSMQNFLQSEQMEMDEKLIYYIQSLEVPKRLKESVLYSIEAGGKRLRPLLMKLTCLGLGGKEEKVFPASVALEMIHTYSLIHDDLPAMDDDKYRRGQLTNHIKFDEATAILAGDSLLTNSFHIITSATNYTDQEKIDIIAKLSVASGMEGMIAGQYLDMEAENSHISVQELEKIHRLKTGQLIAIAIEIGGSLANATIQQLHQLKQLGEYLGLIFQIQDDILDVEGDSRLLGKKVGSDIHNDKSTYPSLLGLEGAKKHKEKYVGLAKQLITDIGLKNTKLENLADYLSERNQ